MIIKEHKAYLVTQDPARFNSTAKASEAIYDFLRQHLPEYQVSKDKFGGVAATDGKVFATAFPVEDGAALYIAGRAKPSPWRFLLGGALGALILSMMSDRTASITKLVQEVRGCLLTDFAYRDAEWKRPAKSTKTDLLKALCIIPAFIGIFASIFAGLFFLASLADGSAADRSGGALVLLITLGIGIGGIVMRKQVCSPLERSMQVPL